MTTAPIVIFLYRRPDHTKRLLACLDACYRAYPVDHPVVIYIDGPRQTEDLPQVEEVRRIVQEWKAATAYTDVTIHAAERNRGLAVSVIEGVTAVVGEYGRVIVLEDDLVLTPDALDYFER